MTSKTKVALLPLYLKLYDDIVPKNRPIVDSFVDTVVSQLGTRDLDVLQLPVCRIAEEFSAAIATAEAEGAQALVTLHLAYSPSLESDQALASTSLPLVVCDTTPTFEFGPEQSPKEIMANHGIHGVQDMCNLLIRNGKPFAIEAGHYEESDVLDRVAAQVKRVITDGEGEAITVAPGQATPADELESAPAEDRAAAAAASMRSARVGRIGEPFAGMGDFAIAPEVLARTTGATTVPTSPADIAVHLPSDDDPLVDAEIEADRARFDCSGVTEEQHRLSVRTGLAVRRWLAEENLSAFTANFLEITKANKLPVMPFLEASKAMSRGIGYAGEGDALTAALVGALASSFGNVSFTEMFCPGWKENCVFLSHMGEINIDLTAAKPILHKRDWSYTDAQDPVIAHAALKPGDATFVNLAPGPNESYTLIAAPVAMILEGDDEGFQSSIRGWFRPRLPLADFLAAYSRVGGTHHAAIVYGDVAEEMATLAGYMGWQSQTIG